MPDECLQVTHKRDSLCKFLTLMLSVLGPCSYYQGGGVAYIDSLNCFAANSLLPSALRASAMIVDVSECILLSLENEEHAHRM